MASHPPDKQVECIIPVLGVANLSRSIASYIDLLGFAVEWGGHEGAEVCGIRRDGCAVMLSEHASPGAWVWIGLETDDLFQTLPRRGVKVIQEPENRAWAYEMKLADPDGNVLWLGTETRKDLPVLGT
ncbi:MAG: VOC family protein [Planctomycetota bacterium]